MSTLAPNLLAGLNIVWQNRKSILYDYWFNSEKEIIYDRVYHVCSGAPPGPGNTSPRRNPQEGRYLNQVIPAAGKCMSRRYYQNKKTPGFINYKATGHDATALSRIYVNAEPLSMHLVMCAIAEWIHPSPVPSPVVTAVPMVLPNQFSHSAPRSGGLVHVPPPTRFGPSTSNTSGARPQPPPTRNPAPQTRGVGHAPAPLATAPGQPVRPDLVPRNVVREVKFADAEEAFSGRHDVIVIYLTADLPIAQYLAKQLTSRLTASWLRAGVSPFNQVISPGISVAMERSESQHGFSFTQSRTIPITQALVACATGITDESHMIFLPKSDQTDKERIYEPPPLIENATFSDFAKRVFVAFGEQKITMLEPWKVQE
ncbi:MAG TPA: T3SS effector HopA1 family protein [Stellaceae bacterium]|jgi:hypothetical protein|nr:T3SS effector HopA1 family protein [Stellaceae bacterium]